MQGNGAIDLATASEEASERELNFGGVAFLLSHTREHFGSVIDAVVDEMLEADVVVTRQSHRACDRALAADVPRGCAYEHECEAEQKWRQVDHCAPRLARGVRVFHADEDGLAARRR
jgi:hypothetical protein